MLIGRTAKQNEETEHSESEVTSRTLLPRGWCMSHGYEASNVLAAIDYNGFPKCDIISPYDNCSQSCSHLL